MMSSSRGWDDLKGHASIHFVPSARVLHDTAAKTRLEVVAKSPRVLICLMQSYLCLLGVVGRCEEVHLRPTLPSTT
jgi:hypothetical protein